MRKISKIAALIIMLSLVGVACSGVEDDPPCVPTEQNNWCGDGPPQEEWTEAGTLADTEIKFYRGEGVSTAQMDAFITMFENSWRDDFNPAMHESFANNITEIRLTSDNSGVSHQGTVLYVDLNATIEEIGSYCIENGIVSLSKLIQPAQKEQLTSRKLNLLKTNLI